MVNFYFSAKIRDTPGWPRDSDAIKQCLNSAYVVSATLRHGNGAMKYVIMSVYHTPPPNCSKLIQKGVPRHFDEVSGGSTSKSIPGFVFSDSFSMICLKLTLIFQCDLLQDFLLAGDSVIFGGFPVWWPLHRIYSTWWVSEWCLFLRNKAESYMRTRPST